MLSCCFILKGWLRGMVIYASCHESHPLYFDFFFFLHRTPRGLTVSSYSGETRRICFPSPSKMNLIGLVEKQNTFFTARTHTSGSHYRSRTAHCLPSSLSLSLALSRSLSVHSDQLGPSAVLCWHNGMLKILMHKWSMLHCTRLWHMFEHGCWCCCCFLKQEGKNFCICFWFWLKSRAADDLDHSHVWFMIYSHPGKISTGTTMHLIWHLITPCGFSPSSLCGVERLVW